MRVWAVLGMLLVLGAAVPLVMLRDTGVASAPAATWMTGFSNELDDYARKHDGRFPTSYGDILLEVRAAHAQSPVDPWGRMYVYERHPVDPRQARVYTLGDPRRVGDPRDDSQLAMYRDGGRRTWHTRLDDVPHAWNDALMPQGLGRGETQPATGLAD